MSEKLRHMVHEIYCEVLFEMAEESDKIETILSDIDAVNQLFQDSPDFAAIMTSPEIKATEKSDIIRRVFTGRVDNLTLDFLSVLARRGRMGFLTGISDRYERLLDIHQDRRLIEVTLPTQPTDEQAEKLKENISNAINAKVKLTVEVDPEMIGGIVIHNNGKVIDNSIRTILKRTMKTVTENLKVKIDEV